MVTADGDHGELGELEFRPQPEYDAVEHRKQLTVAGRLLSAPSDSTDQLLHVLDQLWKLLSKVEQSPDNIMKEALSSPIKALVDARLLKHSNINVKVLVACCLCEITRITAPDAPYSDEELKGIFECIVSSLEILPDNSSQFYNKRFAILDIVSKVRSCVIMLDLECDDLIVRLFEHFLNSVRDHHLGDIFSLMANIMAVVLEESEEISLDLLKLLLASVKNNSEGVLPVARKLGEEVIKRSADKIRPYLHKAMTTLGDSLVDYSQLLTSISEGTTDFIERKDESASVQSKEVDTVPEIVLSEDASRVTSNVGVQQSKNPEGAVDQSGSSLTNKLDGNNSVAKNSENVESAPDTTTKSAEPFVSGNVDGEDTAEKTPEIVVSVQKPLESEVANAPSQSGSQQEASQNKIQIKKGIRSKKKGPSQTDLPSKVSVLTSVNEVTSDSEMRSPKRIRKMTEKAEENKLAEISNSGLKLAKKSAKKVGGGSAAKKPKLSGKKVPESKKSKEDDDKELEAGDSAAKKPQLSGKEVPELKKPREDDNKELKAGDSAAKKPRLSGKEVPESKKPREDDNKELKAGDSAAKKPKLSGKKVSESKKSKQGDANKELEAGNSAAKKPQLSGKEVPESKKPREDDNEELKAGDSAAKKPKLSGKKVSESKKSKQDDANKEVEAGDSAAKKPKVSGKKVSESKKSKQDDANKEVEAGDSVAKKPKLSGKKVPESKRPKQNDNKAVEAGDSEVKPAKRSHKKDNETDLAAKPLKTPGKKVQKRKVVTTPSEDIADKDEVPNTGDKSLELSENDEETVSDHRALNLSENDEDEETETDSDNIPLSLSAKRLNKSKSSVVNSSSKNKDGKKQERGKIVEEELQTKSLPEDDDGMDVSLKSALKMVKGKGNLEGALSTGSKRKRSVTKKKVAETVKYDDSLVGQKVKVWWPEDKMFYEGVIEAFESAEKKHTVSYLDGDEETLNLRTEKWEIIKEFSTPNKEVVFEDQNNEVLPEIAGSSKGETKVNTKAAESKEDEETKKDAKKASSKKIVYSRGKKGSKSKTKSPVDDVKESGSGNAAEEAESEKQKLSETPKTGSKTGKKKQKIN